MAASEHKPVLIVIAAPKVGQDFHDLQEIIGY